MNADSGAGTKEEMGAQTATYNEVGIKNDLDWNRIKKLLRIGLFAGVMVLIGDVLLGWSVSDPALKALGEYALLADHSPGATAR